MIRHSLAAFINAGELASVVGLTAYVQTPDLVWSELKKPAAVITYLMEGKQDQWVLGDASRKENPRLQVTFLLKRAQDVVDVRARFKRLIESATATDVGSVTHPGMNYIPTGDLLRDSGDHLTYISDQPGWFTSPVPVIYKEDANGNPVVVASGYTVNYTAGTITFSGSQGAGAAIRATYKAGLVDFQIAGINEPQLTDQENNPHKYNVVFDLLTWFLIKATANKYL